MTIPLKKVIMSKIYLKTFENFWLRLIRRKHKNRARIRQYNNRQSIEAIIYRWWRKVVSSHGDLLSLKSLSKIDARVQYEVESRLAASFAMLQVREGSNAAAYLRVHALAYGNYLYAAWRDAARRGELVSYHQGIQANVLTVQEGGDVSVNYLNTRWCVDSGANRDICCEVSMAQGRAIPRRLIIGEPLLQF